MNQLFKILQKSLIRRRIERKMGIEATNCISSIDNFTSFHEHAISEANKHLDIHRSRFEIMHGKVNRISPDTGMFLYILPLIEQLKNYYNDELCISAALCKAAFENDCSLKVRAYYCENVIFRLESIWEYLFITLSEYLHTDLVVGYDIKDEMIEAKCHDIRFVKHEDGGMKPIITPLEPKARENIKENLKRELKIFKISQKNRSNSVYRSIKRKYCINDRIQAIFDLYKSPPVNEIVNLRNEIIHRRPLGAKQSMGKLGFMPGQAVNINKNGWYDVNKLPELIDQNLDSVKSAIQILYELTFFNDVPNTIENKDKEFFVYNINCSDCLKPSVIADIHIEKSKESDLPLICPWCKSEKINIHEQEKVNERFYYSNLNDYLKILISHWSE